MKKTMLIVAVALMTMLPMGASAAFVGRVVIGRPVYGGFYRPYWGPYWGGYAPAYYMGPAAGEIKIDTKVKDAQVFINGAYAGTTHDNKTMHLRPGNYRIEIREAGADRFSEQVYVVAGKTLHIAPAL